MNAGFCLSGSNSAEAFQILKPQKQGGRFRPSCFAYFVL